MIVLLQDSYVTRPGINQMMYCTRKAVMVMSLIKQILITPRAELHVAAWFRKRRRHLPWSDKVRTNHTLTSSARYHGGHVAMVRQIQSFLHYCSQKQINYHHESETNTSSNSLSKKWMFFPLKQNNGSNFFTYFTCVNRYSMTRVFYRQPS